MHTIAQIPLIKPQKNLSTGMFFTIIKLLLLLLLLLLVLLFYLIHHISLPLLLLLLLLLLLALVVVVMVVVILPQGKRYSQELKQFAVTLHYYSPQAYQYCKSILSLPDVSSIRNWLSNVDCNPGFLSNVINLCSKLDPFDSNFSLVIDSMSIKKQTSYAGGHFTGFCDYGGIVAEDRMSCVLKLLSFFLYLSAILNCNILLDISL